MLNVYQKALENGDYQRSVFYVSDVNTDEQSVEIEIGAEAGREEAEALEEGRVEHMVHMRKNIERVTRIGVAHE